MMIEDAELRELYKTTTKERLQKLEAGLIHLEKHPNDQTKLEEFLREAHTLKGDSRMLGISDVETLTHQLEDSLAAVKRGETALTAQMCDRLYQGLDAINKLVHEAVTGEAANVNTFLVLAQLMGADANPAFTEITPVNTSDDLLFDELTASVSQIVDETVKIDSASEEPIVTVSVDNHHIDTIRVEPEKLDTLLTQAGELSVTKLRLTQRMSEIEDILNFWEEWSKDTLANRLVFHQIEQHPDNEELKRVQHFQESTATRIEHLGVLINQLKSAAYEDTTRLDTVAERLESGIQNLRLLPLSNIFSLFPRMVRDLAKQQGKEINFVVEGGDTKVDKRILEEIKDPLLHILRNAIDHGIETPQERERLGKTRTATLQLLGYQVGNNILIEVKDDGRGLNLDSIKNTAMRRGICSEDELTNMTTEQIQSLIFAPGFSTRTEVTEISGRGVGLDVVRANVERLKGSISVESNPGLGCKFCLQLNTTLATTHVLIVEVNNTPYALPVEFVQKILLVSLQEIFAIEGSQTINFEGQPVSVVWLADLLELPATAPNSTKTLHSQSKTIPCIILKIGNDCLGIVVDSLLDRLNIVLKPPSKLLVGVRNISGSTLLSNGEVCIVLNARDLLESVQLKAGSGTLTKVEQVQTKHKLLLVEDSIIIRTQMKRLLESSGYEVIVAVDGLEGFNKLRAGNFDAVVSDVEMPNLNGLQLTAKIRQYQEYRELPILLVTTLASDEDRRKGAQAGANAYLTKGDFDQKILLDTLKRLI
ncbi:hybrid sensor histidine kinase/response regulator [Pleurocapsales cyanobacterium LEGE 06147]|nr:hybrid sensor histidine kinase/response regulator [Pleurocapsales cyanobacterium LEGE 06147]